MNLKLIEKLAKLANNNPNDHEANAAARKVCRLLAEGNFNFNSNSQEGTWASVKRTSEPGFKSKSPTRDEQQKQHYEDIFNYFYGRSNPFRDPVEDFNSNFREGGWTGFDKQKREEQKRKCSICGLETRTFNTDKTFVCKICTMRDIENKKKGIHQCINCNHQDWNFSQITNSYHCQHCGYSISKIKADAENRRME